MARAAALLSSRRTRKTSQQPRGVFVSSAWREAALGLVPLGRWVPSIHKARPCSFRPDGLGCRLSRQGFFNSLSTGPGALATNRTPSALKIHSHSLQLAAPTCRTHAPQHTQHACLQTDQHSYHTQAHTKRTEPPPGTALRAVRALRSWSTPSVLCTGINRMLGSVSPPMAAGVSCSRRESRPHLKRRCAPSLSLSSSHLQPRTTCHTLCIMPLPTQTTPGEPASPHARYTCRSAAEAAAHADAGTPPPRHLACMRTHAKHRPEGARLPTGDR